MECFIHTVNRIKKGLNGMGEQVAAGFINYVYGIQRLRPLFVIIMVIEVLDGCMAAKS